MVEKDEAIADPKKVKVAEEAREGVDKLTTLEEIEKSELGQVILSTYEVSEFVEIVGDEMLCFQFLNELSATEEDDDDGGGALMWHFYPHELKLLIEMIAGEQPEVLLEAMNDPDFPINDPAIIGEAVEMAKKAVGEGE